MRLAAGTTREYVLAALGYIAGNAALVAYLLAHIT
jgi:hypothetical protein